MNLFKFVKWVGFLTFLALIYIHMQMSIIDNAYIQERQDQRIKELSETNGNMRYAILHLKSANYIGDKIFADKSDMKFVDQANVITVSSVPVATAAEPAAPEKKDLAGSLLSMLNNGIKK
ncbi:MAG: hypothetical protein HQL26_08950 [Candidatus Omnitrophica bacterium]|nr:hypothetical protein [Candidatus Omnitrophota bacterium]